MRRALAIAAAIATSTALTVGVAPAAFAGTAPHPFTDSKPNWLPHAHRLGATAASTKVSFGLLLNLRDEAAAQAEVQRLSDPTSASYGQWLTNTQFDATYGPTRSQVSAVQQWLRSEGFSVGTTMRSGLYVSASGTASQVEKAFGTSLASYTFQGRTVRANSTALSLPSSTPSSVVAAVQGVVGLDQGTALKQPATSLPGPPAGSRYGVQPCSAYYGQKIAYDKPSADGTKQPYAVCGYTPSQYQSAYGESSLLKSGVDGRGVTVAITDAYAAPTIYSDSQKYSAVHGQPLFKPGQFRQILPSSFNVYDPADAQGWYGEETLDVQAVHAMAPGAKIVYVGGSDDLTGLDTAWAQTIDDHVADIITNSWSDGVDDVADLGQSYIDFYQVFSLEAALTGITVNFSTGDDGDSTAGGTDLSAKTVGFPSDLPLVTGVGGTSVLIGKRGQWLDEYGWQTAYSTLSTDGKSWSSPAYSSGGGGGTSQLFAQPFYQRGVVPASVSEYYGSTPMRATPDISMPGDPNTGMLVGETQTFPNGTYWAQYRIGGTSLSSPLMAGVLAVAEQRAHRILGFVNPLYYRLSGSSAIHDIVAPTKPVEQVRTDFTNFLDSSEGYLFRLQTIDVQSTTLHDTAGWDDETGVGTPAGPAFFSQLGRWWPRR